MEISGVRIYFNSGMELHLVKLVLERRREIKHLGVSYASFIAVSDEGTSGAHLKVYTEVSSLRFTIQPD